MTSARTARVVALASGTMASRVTGFLRTLVAAYVLGFTPFADAFNLANTLPNSLYDLVIGGVVSATFVTVFTHRLTVDGDRKAWRSISTVASFTLLLLIAATLLVWVFAPYVVDAMTSLHHLDPRRTAEQLAQQRGAVHVHRRAFRRGNLPEAHAVAHEVLIFALESGHESTMDYTT